MESEIENDSSGDVDADSGDLPVKRSRLGVVQWLEIVNLARNGTPISVIAEQYKVNKSAIYRGLERRGVKVGELVEQARREEEKAEQKRAIERIKKTKETSLARLEILSNLGMDVVVRHRRGDVTLATALDEIRLAKSAGDLVRGNISSAWKILGLDRDNAHVDEVIPELVVRELSEFEVAEIRRKQRIESGSDLSAEEMLLISDQLSGQSDEEDEVVVEEKDEDEP